jgi:RecA/RadA recombinase
MAKKAVKELEAGRKKKEAKYITTGSTIRDLIIGGDKGCLGYRVGNIYNVVSDSGSGKTFLSVQSIVANHFILGDKFVWNYDDNEDGNQFDVYSIYGMESPLMDEDTLISNSVEELYVNLRRFKNKVDKDQIGMYVVDSLDGLASQATLDRGNERFEKAEKGKEFTDGTYAMDKQKFLSQEFFPQAMEIINNSNIVLVIISQVRDKINAGMFEKKQTRSGGRALQFYCHTVEWLATVEKKEMEDEETGLRTGIPVLIETTKSRTARPLEKVLSYLTTPLVWMT